MQRIALMARLTPGGAERAQELIAAGLPGAAEDGVARMSVFMTSTDVVFVCEGVDVEASVRRFFDDPVRSTAFSSWLALFDGPLTAAREVAGWEAPHG